MTVIIDGNSIASEVASRVRTQLEELSFVPTLGIIVATESEVIRSYVKRKKDFARSIGVEIEEVVLSEGTTSERIQQEIHDLQTRVDALVVQLPLPQELNQEKVVSSIDPAFDVDCLHADNTRSDITSPVAQAVLEILDRSVSDWQSKKLVLVGQGKLVGKPLGRALAKQGVSYTVVDVTTSTEERRLLLHEADIVISGTGVPGLIAPEDVREGVVLIDAGTATSQGTVVGDIDKACYEKASVVSPVPGGVGPVSVAMLFTNVLKLALGDKAS